MTMDNEALEPITLELEIQSAIPDKQGLGISAKDNFPMGINNAKTLLKAVDRVAQGGKLVITLDVPKWVKTGLETGQYIRKGGVIVTSEGHHVKWWLKEAKVSRLGKTVTFATIFVDILSEILLNRKLKEIQVQLESIEDYIKAEHLSPLLDAHEDLRTALGMKDPTKRQAVFWKARDNFRTARGKNITLFNIKKGRIHKEIHVFVGSQFSNKGELEHIYKCLSEMLVLANTIVHCYQAEARIFETLEEPGQAERLRVECMNFQLALYEYTGFIVHGSPSYADLELVRKDNLEVQSVDLKSFYPLHRHIGALNSQGGILSQRKALFEKVKDCEKQIAIQYCEMAKVETGRELLRLPDEQGVVYLPKQ